MSLRLVVVEGPRKGAQLRLEQKDALVVGSSPLADLQLPAPGVAGVHLRLLRRAEGWTCVDVSGRGFELRGRTIGESALRPGDVLRLGEHDLQVLSDKRRSAESPAVEPPPPPADAPAGPALIAVEGNDTGKRFALDADGPMIMGRGATTHITLWDIRASRAHARIDPRDDGAFLVQDLGSSNGTYVNGARLESPHLLNSGDKIQIGSTVLVFEG